jgi:cell volume regulation protein A
MDSVNSLLLAASLLLFVSILLSNVTSRLGVPFLLLFLVVGMAAGEDGPGQIQFSDVGTAFLVGNLALAIILLDGGLRTPLRSVRVALAPALTLATFGVVVTAGLLGAFCAWWFGFDWRYALLLAAIVGSTDAAAVFSVLRQGGVQLNERVAATLEVESGANDPMAIFLVLILIEWLRTDLAPGAGGLLLELLRQFGIGAAGGLAGGWLLSSLLGRVRLAEGLYPLLIASGGLLLFAAVGEAGGSGFLAIYLAGLVIGNRPTHATDHVMRVMDGLAWLAQAGMFLLLGLLVTPSALVLDLPIAVTVAVFLMLVARPLAVAVSLAPFRMAWRETAFISWVGLRGAVPVVLSIFPLMAGLPGSMLLFEVAFAVVLGSLLVQGLTIAPVARALGVWVPAGLREPDRLALPLPVTPLPQVMVLPVDAQAPCAGRSVTGLMRDVSPAGSSQCSAIARDGRLLFPLGEEHFRLGDVAVVIAHPQDDARLLRAFTPMAASERRATLRFFGEFVLSAEASVGDVAAAYGVQVGDVDPALTLAGLLRERVGKRVVVGDRVTLDRIKLIVRETEGGAVTRVGLKLVSEK